MQYLKVFEKLRRRSNCHYGIEQLMLGPPDAVKKDNQRLNVINHQIEANCKYNRCSCHQLNKFSPLAADAEKAEHQSQE